MRWKIEAYIYNEFEHKTEFHIIYYGKDYLDTFSCREQFWQNDLTWINVEYS